MSITPFSGISYLIDGILALVAWGVIMHRRKQMPSHQLDIWAGLFGLLGVFLVLMSVPHVVIYFDRADLFPDLMNWGYIISHFFLYLGLASLIRMDALLFDWLYGREKLLQWIWVGFAFLITGLNIAFPNQPSLTDQGITILGASSVIGAAIPIISLLTSLPLSIAFLRGAARSKQAPGQRLRSFLLGTGILMVFAAGPAHDFIRTPHLLIFADALTALALFILLMGVLYKPHLAPTPQQNDSK